MGGQFRGFATALIPRSQAHGPSHSRSLALMGDQMRNAVAKPPFLSYSGHGHGFMIDAPLRVAKYGLSSVISLVNDVLIEQMRPLPLPTRGRALRGDRRPPRRTARARRITAYLDLLDRLVHEAAALQASPFEAGKRDHALLRNAARGAVGGRISGDACRR